VTKQRWTDEQLIKAVETATCYNDVLKGIGLKEHSNAPHVRKRIKELDLDPQYKKRTWTKEQLVNAVENNISIASAIAEIGLKPSGANYAQFHRYCKEYNLDTSHFKGKGYLKGRSHNHSARTPLEEILVENCQYSSHRLKLRLYEAGLKEEMCENCGITDWNGQKLSLHLDHINGKRDDNRLENLRVLCPNCHSQTETYAGKNKKIAAKKI
jgi:hypothetical protein